MRRPTRYFSAYVLDLDGTVYLGTEWIPGARETVETLRQRDIPVRFLSNNPTRTPEQYAAKLTAMGLPTPVADVVNPVVTTCRWLQENHPGAVVYPIGEEPLVHAMCAAGIHISDHPAEIDIVVASYDRTFTYEKLQIAFDAIRVHQRARLITTNPDRYCPTAGGGGEPDAASIVAAIEAATGTVCDANMGKPDVAIARLALADLDVDPQDCLMVGDRLSTDIQLAFNAGMRSALVLTGDSSLDDVAAATRQPDFVLPSVADLVPRTGPTLTVTGRPP